MSFELHVDCSYRGGLVDAIIQDRHAAVGFQLLIAHIIAIENGSGMYSQPLVSQRIKIFKETSFSAEIRCHRLMKIKMLMRKVRHDPYIKIAAGDSMQL